jgi:hypothetical protein
MNGDRILLALLAGAMLGMSAAAAPVVDDTAADTLVLCPDAFQTVLRPWVEYRQKQGHRVLVLAPAATSFGVQRQVREVATKHALRNLVIIGDAFNDKSQGKFAIVPTDYKIAMVNVQFGGEPEIATDNPYADLDGDGKPDLALGRIPVDSPDQLEQYIRKVIAYETTKDFGPWRRKINLVAGTGNFDPIVDRVIENASKRLITDLIPAAFETSLTLTNWQSNFCPDPRRLSTTVVERMNEGCLFWVYIGHGLPNSVAPMQVGRRSFPVLDNRVAVQARAASGLPIAVFLSCYSGAFDRREDCLGEVLVCQPAGPVACLCGSRLTMPYGMALLSVELMDEFFGDEEATLGEVFTRAKRKLAGHSADGEYRQMIENLGQSLSPTPDLLPLERHEHLLMFHLLGDPLLRVPRPSPLALAAALSTGASHEIRISGTAPEAGNLTVELCYKRDRLRGRTERRKEFNPDQAALAAYDEVYRQSNDRICISRSLPVAAGEFQTSLAIPQGASGECHVRGYLQSGRQAWAQAVPIDLR